MIWVLCPQRHHPMAAETVGDQTEKREKAQVSPKISRAAGEENGVLA